MRRSCWLGRLLQHLRRLIRLSHLEVLRLTLLRGSLLSRVLLLHLRRKHVWGLVRHSLTKLLHLVDLVHLLSFLLASLKSQSWVLSLLLLLLLLSVTDDELADLFVRHVGRTRA